MKSQSPMAWREAWRKAWRKIDLAGALLALAWVGVLFWSFSPGLMSPDSLSQYGQGLSGDYSNAHPPFMSWAMGLSGKAVGSPAAFLLLVLLALGGGMALLVRGGTRWGLVVLLIYLATPTIWSLGVVLWKDSAIAGVLLLCVAALHAGHLRTAFALMVCSMLLRHNAIVAVAPLLFFAVGQVRALTTRWARGLAFAGSLVVLSLAPRVGDALSKAKSDCAVCVPAVFDLAVVYIDSPELFSNSIFANDVSVEELKVAFQPSTVVFLLWGSEPVRHIKADFVFSHREEVLSEWLSVVPRRPWAYLKGRLALFSYLLGMQGDVFYAFHTGLDTNPWGLRVTHDDSRLHQALRAVQELFRNSLAFRGWFWLALCTVLGGLSLWRRRPLAFACALSGFLYTVTLMLVVTSADFRFVFWTVVSCFASAALLLTPSPVTTTSAQ